MRRYAEEAGDNVTVEGALHAWIDTDLNLQIDDAEQWAAFGKIAAQANSAAGWGAEKMTKYFNPVVLALIELLKKAMPDCDEEKIFWGYHFVSGAMTHNMARTGRLDDLSHGLCSSSDFESIRKHMAKFMAAGFKAICQGPDRNEEEVGAEWTVRRADPVDQTSVSRESRMRPALLCLVYVLNFLDRQLLSILAKPIQDELGHHRWSARAVGRSLLRAVLLHPRAYPSPGWPIEVIGFAFFRLLARCGARRRLPAVWRRTMRSSPSLA